MKDPAKGLTKAPGWEQALPMNPASPNDGGKIPSPIGNVDLAIADIDKMMVAVDDLSDGLIEVRHRLQVMSRGLE